ncbi:CarD family transcriptional regulator [Pseudalgibacter alginicilyticus]|uniref:CarD family transcriptional regulator n=1 Tax=Pseudalgibacter alginicilyticus TaxID=1736674 RepID=A0A0P0D261_9FLAO|nr:Crp/Fnr family transcriptional regulator [Pseudalgibacter alginicilyticus]ALJ04993.1 CarD family transcriptional regulator [Pseudalgibacter alginicilyticus]
MSKLRSYLETIVDVDDADWNYFSSRLIKREFPKKNTFLKTGNVENYISFIEKGCVRLFIPKAENEKEITFGFCLQSEFVSAYDSFLTQTPSLYQLETLIDTTLWSISYADLQDVYRKTKIGNTIGRFTAEKLFLIKSRREQSLLNESAEQRYINLFHDRPNIIKHIPLKYIASYIGVTPQALSRIRKRIY